MKRDAEKEEAERPDPMTDEGQKAIMRRLTTGDGEQTSEPDGAADHFWQGTE